MLGMISKSKSPFSIFSSYSGIWVFNIGIKAIIWIELTKFQPEVMSPVINPATKAELTAAVAVEELVFSSASASSISWSVY